jgi:NAD+ kinase
MMTPKILVVYKESSLTRIEKVLPLPPRIKLGDYWEVLKGSHQRHNDTVQGVRSHLKKMRLKVDFILRRGINRLGFVDRIYGLVVTVGGDGTILDASHRIKNIPLLGVNSDPMRSVARFSGCNLDSFPGVLEGFLSGHLKPIPVPRLEFSVNGRKYPWPVLNDLLVTTLSPAGTSRYTLKVGNWIEEQMSSGVWISTPAGSTAANLSAGGKILPATQRCFQYVVREAYLPKFGRRSLIKGILGPKAVLDMVSFMRDGQIFMDGANNLLPFVLGDHLEVKLSPHPLPILGFNLKKGRIRPQKINRHRYP